jgi:hypothetical protein
MVILQLLCKRHYCPANIRQLNCLLNYSAITSQPPSQNTTDSLFQLSWLYLGTDHIENNVILLLRPYLLRGKALNELLSRNVLHNTVY